MTSDREAGARELLARFERAVIMYVQCARPSEQALAKQRLDNERQALTAFLLPEEAAQVAEEMAENASDAGTEYDDGAGASGYRMACTSIANAFRALSEKKMR